MPFSQFTSPAVNTHQATMASLQHNLTEVSTWILQVPPTMGWSKPKKSHLITNIVIIVEQTQEAKQTWPWQKYSTISLQTRWTLSWKNSTLSQISMNTTVTLRSLACTRTSIVKGQTVLPNQGTTFSFQGQHRIHTCSHHWRCSVLAFQEHTWKYQGHTQHHLKQNPASRSGSVWTDGTAQIGHCATLQNARALHEPVRAQQ